MAVREGQNRGVVENVIIVLDRSYTTNVYVRWRTRNNCTVRFLRPSPREGSTVDVKSDESSDVICINRRQSVKPIFMFI